MTSTLKISAPDNTKSIPMPDAARKLKKMNERLREKRLDQITDKIRERVEELVQEIYAWQERRFKTQYDNHEHLPFDDDIAEAKKRTERPQEIHRRFPRGDKVKQGDGTTRTVARPPSNRYQH